MIVAAMMEFESYSAQNERWPKDGRVILAQHDPNTVVVYQAYRPSIGRFAVEHQRFGGEFSFNRMSWIKPNFLWMMYRSSWGTSDGQQTVLAIRLRRHAFEEILSVAVGSTFNPRSHGSHDEWRKALKGSDVRLQWDPDHDPAGNKLNRRAIQLGLRGAALSAYAKEWIVEIEDISKLVTEQRTHAVGRAYDRLMTPREAVYTVASAETAERLELDHGHPRTAG